MRDAPETAPSAIYPFSLVLGSNFRPRQGYNASKGEREIRSGLQPLLGPSTPHLSGRLFDILARGEIRFTEVPEIEPHVGEGVTFSDPETLYREWEDREDVGPGLGRAMRNIIWFATHPAEE